VPAVIVGVDFDNTIVCYDAIFHRVARERDLIPEGLRVSKNAVREHLRGAGQEALWTELQGYVYGPRMPEAEPFPGVEEFFRRARAMGLPLLIISHRTRYPYLGERYDLHQAARDWLAAYGFHDPAGIGLPRERVYFELTKQEKLARVRTQGCTHFIDDLPELFEEPDFPVAVQKILFDPSHACPRWTGARAADWATISLWLLDGFRE
jgi:hypothetical protein